MSWPTSLNAQAAANVLPPTREEVTRPVTPPTDNRPPRLDVEGGIERTPCALDSAEFASIKFTLRGAEFDGLKGLAPQDLASSYAPYVGKEVPISVVCAIRDRAAVILRDAGYLAAVQVPEQRVEDGTVHFTVLMAHLTQIRVRGDASGAEKIIAGYLSKLTDQPVFNRFEAERYLLLASDIPGYYVRLTLRPAGTVPGDVIGDVTAQRTKFFADLNVQDLGSHELGRWGGMLRAQAFGLTGMGDRTTISAFSTADFHEQQTLQIGHDFRVGSEGLSFGGSLTFAWARPDIADARVKARTLFGTIQADYPFVRRLGHSVRGTVGIDIANQNVDLNGIALTRDRLRVPFVRLGFDAAKTDFDDARYSLAEPPWRVSAQFEARQGLRILGATRDCGPTGARCLGPGEVPPSRLEGQSDATVLRFTGFGELRPIPRLTLALGARAQYAWKPLLSFEEFSAGDYTTGRGYDPGTLLGDRGIGTQAEIRYGTRIPPSSTKPAIEGFGFWDFSRVSNKDKLTVLDQSNHLNSVGGGAWVAIDRFSLDAAIAFPLTRVGLDDKRPGPRFLISLTTRLWPWSY